MSPRFFLLVLLVVVSMCHGFEPIRPAFEVPKEPKACVEQLAEFAKSFCTSECKNGFQDIIKNACETQVDEHTIMNACCEQK